VINPPHVPLSPCACLREAASAKAGERERVRGEGIPLFGKEGLGEISRRKCLHNY